MNGYIDSQEGMTKAPSTGYGFFDAAIQEYENLNSDISEKDRDTEVLKLANDQITQGADPKETFKTIDRPDFHKGLYYKKLVDSGVEPSKASTLSGVSQESVERAGQGFLANFVDGVKADYTELAYGIRATMLPEDDLLQADRRVFVNKYKADNEIRKGLSAEYDDEGDRNEAWNWGAGIGEMAMDVGFGFGAGSAAKTASKVMLTDIGISTASESMKYQMHQDKLRLGLGIGSAIAGNLVGNWVQNSFMPTGKKPELKSVRELDESLSMLKLLENSGITLDPDILSDTTKLGPLIDKTLKNPFEREALKTSLGEANDALTGKILSMTNELGTTPAKFAAYRNGEVSIEEMGTKFKQTMEFEKSKYRLKEDELYNSAKTMDTTKQIGSEGKFNTYNINESTPETPSLIAQLNDATRSSQEAAGVIRNELNFLRKTEDPKMVEVRGKISEYHTNVDKIDSKVNKLDSVRGKLKAQIEVMNKRGEEPFKYSTNERIGSAETKFNLDFKRATKGLSNIEAEMKQLKQSRAGYVTQINKLNTKFKSTDQLTVTAPFTKEGDPIPDKLTANELQLLVRRLNEKIFIPGGTVSMSDGNAIGALTRAKGIVQDYMRASIKDPAFMETLDAGNKVARERFQLLGRQADIVGISNALKHPNPERMYKLVTGEDGWHNLRALGKMMGKDNEMVQDLTTKVVYDKVMTGVSKASAPGRAPGIDFAQLSKNLSDPDFISSVGSVVSSETKAQLKALKGLSDTYGQSLGNALKQVDSIDKLSFLDKINPLNIPGLLSSMKKDLQEVTTSQVGRVISRNSNKVGDPYAATAGKKPVRKSVQDMPIIGEPRWFKKTVHMGRLIAETQKRLEHAKTQPEIARQGDILKQRVANMTQFLLEKISGKGNFSGGFVTREATQALAGGGLGAAVGASAAPEGHKLEGAVVGGVMGAGVGMSIGKGYNPKIANSLAGAEKITNDIAATYPEGSMPNRIYKSMTYSADASRVVKGLSEGHSIKAMPLKARQQALDAIFTTDMEGMGSVGYLKDVDYRGFTIKAKPQDFGKLAAPIDKQGTKPDISSIGKGVADGKQIGEPFLTIKYHPNTNTMEVMGHEGRHRMEYVKEMFGGDVEVPIHIVTMREAAEDGGSYEMRNRDIPKDVVGKSTKWVSELGDNISSAISSKFKYHLYSIIGLGVIHSEGNRNE